MSLQRDRWGARIWRRKNTGIREQCEIREKEKDSATWQEEAGGLLGVSVNPLRLIKVRLVLLGIEKILSFFSFLWNFLPSRPLPFLQYSVLSSFLSFSRIFFLGNFFTHRRRNFSLSLSLSSLRNQKIVHLFKYDSISITTIDDLLTISTWQE